MVSLIAHHSLRFYVLLYLLSEVMEILDQKQYSTQETMPNTISTVTFIVLKGRALNRLVFYTCLYYCQGLTGLFKGRGNISVRQHIGICMHIFSILKLCLRFSNSLIMCSYFTYKDIILRLMKSSSYALPPVTLRGPW